MGELGRARWEVTRRDWLVGVGLVLAELVWAAAVEWRESEVVELSSKVSVDGLRDGEQLQATRPSCFTKPQLCRTYAEELCSAAQCSVRKEAEPAEPAELDLAVDSLPPSSSILILSSSASSHPSTPDVSPPSPQLRQS